MERRRARKEGDPLRDTRGPVLGWPCPKSRHRPGSEGGTAWHTPPGMHRLVRAAWRTVSHSGGCGPGFSLHLPPLTTCTFYLDFFAKRQRDPFRKCRSLRPKGHGPEEEMAKPWDAARSSWAGARQWSPRPGLALTGEPVPVKTALAAAWDPSWHLAPRQLQTPGCPRPLPRGGASASVSQPASLSSLPHSPPPSCPPRLQLPSTRVEGSCHGSGRWSSMSTTKSDFVQRWLIAIAE